MEPTSTLEQTAASNRAAMVSPETDYELNVVMIYQDAATREWATEVWGRITQLVGKDALRITAGKLGELNDPRVLREMVSATILADVIVVSVRATGTLPIDLCSWIDAWRPHRPGRDGVLIALIGGSDQTGAYSVHVREYLRTVAQKGQLEFLLQERALPVALPDSVGPGKIAENGNGIAPMLGQVLGLSHGVYAHWGINE